MISLQTILGLRDLYGTKRVRRWLRSRMFLGVWEVVARELRSRKARAAYSRRVLRERGRLPRRYFLELRGER